MAKYTLIIADDEELSRKAIALLVKKELPEIELVAQATNGGELVQLVQRYQPDMAIVDVNMPGINGIEAIGMLNARGSKTRFIINTAYEDFEYVQRALELKVDAYILKPERRENTVATIRRLCAEIDRSRATDLSNQQIRELFINIQPVLESEILYSLFIGEASTESFRAYCEMHGYRFDSGAVVMLLPVIGNSLKSREKVRKYLHTAFDGSCTYLAAVNESSICLLIFVDAGNPGMQKAWLQDVLEVGLDKLCEDLAIPLRAGVGGIYSSFEKMSDSYREGLLALADQSEQRIRLYSTEQETDAHYQYKKAAQTMMLAVLSGNQQRISTEATHQRKLIQGDRGAALELWKQISLELADKTQFDPVLQMQMNYTSAQLMKPDAYPNFMEIIREALCQIATHLKENSMETDYVEQAMQYIEDHFTEDFSLEYLAQYIGVSSSYLSRQIKVRKGKTFVECLTETRMRMATTLATETRMPIREIALRSGYQNVTYFCRVFKKYTGKTFGEIRSESRQK